MNQLPERIGNYRVLECIGRGGMGAVYKAHDPLLDRLVAIKVMRQEDDVEGEARARFLREAQSSARLNHPNIITVYALGEEPGRAFIVMELLEGETLSQVIARAERVSLRDKLAIMVQVCDGLAYAHQRGVVHRDIKPGNIFVLANGHAKVLDFGIARLPSSDLTRTGLLMGTPNYMAPEQARGRKTDARSDIFSVGVVFYELLSGKKPFAGANYFETLEKVRDGEIPPLAELVPTLPPVLVAAVHRALAKEPSNRFASLDEMRVHLLGMIDTLEQEQTLGPLRDTLDRQRREVERLWGILARSAGLAPERAPAAETAGSPDRLRTMVEQLGREVARLAPLVQDAERLEPAVIRGIAAFDRGAFDDAVAELDAVLAEMPEHERARRFRDQALAEVDRRRTPPGGGLDRAADTPEPSGRRLPGGAALRSAAAAPPARESFTATVTPPPLPGPRQVVVAREVADTDGGRRTRLFFGGAAAIAVLLGGALIFWLPRPPPIRDPASSPAPSAPPAVAPKPPAVRDPSPTPPPVSPPPASRPASPRPAEPGVGTKSPAEARPATEVRPPAARPPLPSAPAVKPPAARPTSPPAAEPPKVATPKLPPAKALTVEQKREVEEAVTLAELFRDRGDDQRALREYQKALTIDPSNPEAKKGLAEVQAALKKKEP